MLNCIFTQTNTHTTDQPKRPTSQSASQAVYSTKIALEFVHTQYAICSRENARKRTDWERKTYTFFDE